MSEAICDALRRRTGSANRGADLTTPSFTGGTRREELMGDYFKPELDTDDEKPVQNMHGLDTDGESDPVNHPAHYKQFGVEVIEIIRHVLGPEGFRAYCVGNELKYRLRAGDKGDAAQDIAKAMKYREFREQSA